jgi:SsrA-binding protein
MSDLLFNRKAGFNYEITDTIVAGIELFGFEVKSLRNKQGSLDGSYVTIRDGEAFLIGADIPPFQQNNTPKEYEQRRERRLLLTRAEINSLVGTKLTIVPVSVYNVGRKIKVKIGLAKSKKKFDKRENIKKRETDRDVRREFRDR